jgi:hypothetical protein
VETVHLARAIPGLVLAVPREVAQVADRHGRHEAAPEQAPFKQLGDPRAIADIGLAPGPDRPASLRLGRRPDHDPPIPVITMPIFLITIDRSG